METTSFTYRDTLAASERIRWRVEDLIGGERALDFERNFLPETLACTEALDFLAPGEKRTLNQVRGHAYLAIFGLVEEFILPFVLDHARRELAGDDYRVRALLQFAGEEAKHIHLFKRFRDEFERGFGSSCGVIGPPEAVAAEVLGHHPLAVALTILHIEWMTQRHYVDCVKDDGALDPQFESLLRHHWMEEAQHAKLDTLMVESLAGACTPEEIDRAIDEYLEIGGFLDAGLGEQTRLDLASLCRATGRRFTGEETGRFEEVQRRANRWTYLGSGMTHPSFLATLGRLRPAARERIAGIAPAFC
ncbi:MAG: hypothetical protein AB1689_06035 [Thermodesulfobacteriota bacterium]